MANFMLLIVGGLCGIMILAVVYLVLNEFIDYKIKEWERKTKGE